MTVGRNTAPHAMNDHVLIFLFCLNKKTSNIASGRMFKIHRIFPPHNALIHLMTSATTAQAMAAVVLLLKLQINALTTNKKPMSETQERTTALGRNIPVWMPIHLLAIVSNAMRISSTTTSSIFLFCRKIFMIITPYQNS